MDGGVLTIRPHRPFLSLWLLLDALFGQIQTLESGSLHSLPLSFAPGSRPLETSARICSWLTPSWIPALPSSLSLWLLAHALFGQIQTLESGSLYPFPSLWLLAHALFGQIQTLESGSLYPFPSPLFGSWLTPSSDRSRLWSLDPFTPFLSLSLLAHALFGQIQTLESGSLYPFLILGSWLTPSSDRSRLWSLDP